MFPGGGRGYSLIQAIWVSAVGYALCPSVGLESGMVFEGTTGPGGVLDQYLGMGESLRV